MRLFIFLSYFAVNFALKINFYPSFGQIREEISVKNGYFQTLFTSEEYYSIVHGTLDFPGQKVLEQDFYSSEERLRNTNVHIGSSSILSKLIDPYQFLIKTDSNRYMYAAKNAIEYSKDPTLHGKILTVRFSNPSTIKMNMTYLTRGLKWTPRYEIMLVNERYATLRALADIYNNHERTYSVGYSQLTTGDVPLATSLMSTSLSDVYFYQQTPVSTKPDVSTFGTRSYNITRRFQLLPKSIKTYPFLTSKINIKTIFESSTYLSSNTQTGLFRRTIIVQAPEFLPGGLATFYLQHTGACLGQGSFVDTPKNKEQIFQMGADSDVAYTIQNTITKIQSNEPHGHDSTVNVVISNKKDKQAVNLNLKIFLGFINTKFRIKKSSSSNIRIIQDPTDQSAIVIQATVKANGEETCMFLLNLSSSFN